MRGLLYSAARHRDRERHSRDEHHAQRIAVAVSGSIREIARVVAMIETADIGPVDLWLDPTCRPLKSILEQQAGIRRVLFSPVQCDPNDRSVSRSERLPVYGSYRDVIQISAGCHWRLAGAASHCQSILRSQEHGQDARDTRP